MRSYGFKRRMSSGLLQDICHIASDGEIERLIIWFCCSGYSHVI
jgi:hypothetical protein